MACFSSTCLTATQTAAKVQSSIVPQLPLVSRGDRWKVEAIIAKHCTPAALAELQYPWSTQDLEGLHKRSDARSCCSVRQVREGIRKDVNLIFLPLRGEWGYYDLVKGCWPKWMNSIACIALNALVSKSKKIHGCAAVSRRAHELLKPRMRWARGGGGGGGRQKAHQPNPRRR